MKKLPCVLLLLPLLMLGQENATEFEKNTISIGLIASDLEASLTFYTDIIGMQETGGFGIDAAFGKNSGLTGGTPFDVKILKLEDDPNATELKIMSFNKEKNPGEKHIQVRNGMRYITIFVKSIVPVLERLKRNNIPFLGKTPIQLGDGRDFILIQDPDGVFVELIGNKTI